MNNNDKLKNQIKEKIAISKFYEEDMAMKNSKNHFMKIAVAVCACFILTSGIVFAKDIESIINKIFNNTSPAIEKAVENGYVQEIAQKFIYDKEVGIKVDNLVLDELNLNVAFKFECNKENLEYIRLNKFVILTDTGEKIFDNDQQYVTDINDAYTASSMTWNNMPQKVAENVFSDSILFTMGERSKEKKELYFRIESLDIVYKDGTNEELEGKWDIDIKIDESMRKSQTIKYVLQEENEHIESCTGTLSATGFQIDLVLKEDLDIGKFFEENEDKVHGHMLFYYVDNGMFIEPAKISGTGTTYTMPFDNISSTTEIPEEIEIYADPFESSIILKIDENMRKSQTVKYVLQEENEHIESCTGTLSASGLEVSFALMSSLDPMKYSIENSGKISGPGFFFIKDSYGYSFPKDINCLDVDCKKYSMKYDSISIFSDIPKEIEIYLEPYDDTIILKKSI